MRMEDLRYLIQVADIGSISLAAEAWYITQQGLSRIISNLEKELGVMDSTAASLCRDNSIAIHVFALAEEGNMKRAVCGEKIGTIIK